jgi:iron complex transport system ATP-binding protein
LVTKPKCGYYYCPKSKSKFKTRKLIALIGANGVGKSTLLRTITGIQNHLRVLNNKKISEYQPLELAQNLSIVLTENTSSNLTVFELVALGRQPYTNCWYVITKR